MNEKRTFFSLYRKKRVNKLFNLLLSSFVRARVAHYYEMKNYIAESWIHKIKIHSCWRYIHIPKKFFKGLNMCVVLFDVFVWMFIRLFPFFFLFRKSVVKSTLLLRLYSTHAVSETFKSRLKSLYIFYIFLKRETRILLLECDFVNKRIFTCEGLDKLFIFRSSYQFISLRYFV